MKGLVKFLGYALGAVAAVIAVAALAIYIGSHRRLGQTYTLSVRTPPIPAQPEAIARGKHLAATRGCIDCHGTDLGGKTVFENPAMGRVTGPNLTRGSGGLPADYSSADFVRAIRHGVGRDGRGLFLMPSTDYATFSDDDLGALIAYLQSAPAVDRTVAPLSLGPIARMLLTTGQIRLAADVIDHANVKPAVVTIGVNVDYGRYVAASCTGCHGNNFAGGKIAAGPPEWPPAANLTPHASGRMKGWTEANFMQALRTGRRPDGTEIDPAMPRAFGGLDDTEIRAVWAFLQTLPAAAGGAP